MITTKQAKEILAESMRKFPSHLSPAAVLSDGWGVAGSAPAVLDAIKNAYAAGKSEK